MATDSFKANRGQFFELLGIFHLHLDQANSCSGAVRSLRSASSPFGGWALLCSGFDGRSRLG